MEVHEIRRGRLEEILRGMSAAALAEAAKIDATLIARYRFEPGKSGAKNIGEENARKIEHGAKKPTGWLDRPHAPTAGDLLSLTTGEALLVGFLRREPGDAALALFQRLQTERQQGERPTPAPAPTARTRARERA